MRLVGGRPPVPEAGAKAAVKSERGAASEIPRTGTGKAGGIDGSDRPATGGGAGSPLIVLLLLPVNLPLPFASLQYYPPRPSIMYCEFMYCSKHRAPRPSPASARPVCRLVAVTLARCLVRSCADSRLVGSSRAEHRRRRTSTGTVDHLTTRAGRGFLTRRSYCTPLAPCLPSLIRRARAGC